jgi:ribose/xylose/arabinose/galactoside ABC-type transport system permease subunit
MVDAHIISRTRRLFAGSVMDLVLLLICIFLALRAPNFLTIDNLLNILRSVSMLGLLAFGMTMVIIAKEIDLSVGSGAAFACCLVAWLMAEGIPAPLSIIITIVVLFCCGLFIGFMRVTFTVPSFITTLALFTAYRGLALMLTKGFPIAISEDWFYYLGGGYYIGIPFPAIVFTVAFVLVYFVMNYTTFGGAIYAVGGNDEAARLSGINVSFVRYMVFGTMGALTAISGILLASRIMSGTPTVAQQWELDAIAAVIIGGTSFNGGVGTVRGTLIGIIFIGVIVNGMTLLNVDIYFQYIVRGGLILAAVMMNRIQEARRL